MRESRKIPVMFMLIDTSLACIPEDDGKFRGRGLISIIGDLSLDKSHLDTRLNSFITDTANCIFKNNFKSHREGAFSLRNQFRVPRGHFLSSS